MFVFLILLYSMKLGCDWVCQFGDCRVVSIVSVFFVLFCGMKIWLWKYLVIIFVGMFWCVRVVEIVVVSLIVFKDECMVNVIC